MNKKMRFLSIVFALVFVAATIAGCSNGGSSDTSGSDTGSDASASEEVPDESATETGGGDVAVSEWSIPMLSILTGPVAFAGIPAGWGAEYAAEIINAEGGIRGVPVKIEVRDTAFDPAKAVSEMSAVVDGALVVLGPMDAPGFDAAGQVAADAKVPVIGAATTPVVREKYAPYSSAYMSDSEAGAAKAVKKWIELNPDFKKVVLFEIPSDNANVSEYEAAKSALEESGVEIAGTVEVETGDLDLGPAATKAISYEADAYFVNLRTEEFVRAVTELRNRGVNDGKKIMGGFSAVSSNLFELGGESIEDVYIWNKIDPTSSDPGWQEFVSAYEADNGSKPDGNTGANFYEAMMLLKAGIEDLELTGDPTKIQEERDALAEYLFNTSPQTSIQGEYQIVDGEKVADPFVFQLKDSSYVKAD